MNFDLTEEQQRIRDTLTAFAEREIKPFAAKWDKEETFPRHVVEKLGELGFLGVAFPEKWGGGAADTPLRCSWSKGSPATTRRSADLRGAYVVVDRTHRDVRLDEHRDHYVPDMLSAQKLGA